MYYLSNTTIMSYFNYNRRKSSITHIGNIPLGGENPIRVQSMTNTNTNDTEASVNQVLDIVNAKADYVRLTAQGVREADNLKNIKAELLQKNCNTPLIADIHFNPRAAEAAARNVEKVRINPGNFVDRVKTFEVFDYTEEEYQQELNKIREKLIPLLNICKEHKTALRIGVNHGSLSDRIMSRYGDTPEGMVESCMEFLRICVAENFMEIVISMKTSNTVVMNHAVRLLIEQMEKENLHIPLHLGVTEAGDGEDGRIKSAVGIGALLSDGIGDTIRVSLSEDPQFEIPVAKKIVAYISQRENHEEIKAAYDSSYSRYSTERRKTYPILNIGGEQLPIVFSDRSDANISLNKDFTPDAIYLGTHVELAEKLEGNTIVDYDVWKDKANVYPLFNASNYNQISSSSARAKFLEIEYKDLNEDIINLLKNRKNIVLIAKSNHVNSVGEHRAIAHRLLINKIETPIIIKREYSENLVEDLQIKAAIDLGTILLDGFGDGVMLVNKGEIAHELVDQYMFGILQAARVRTSKTEYISCPSCGRTLFDLQSTVAKVKAATSHLKHLKIGVMGCIVNGPGEMADADYGYVGAEKNKISLYKRKECIKKNLPAEHAVEELVALIKEYGDWVEPEKN